jgi:hypothetical protein
VVQVLFKEWEGLAHSLDEHAAKVKIFVVSDSGVSHAKMIAELIQSRFYYRVVRAQHWILNMMKASWSMIWLLRIIRSKIIPIVI